MAVLKSSHRHHSQHISGDQTPDPSEPTETFTPDILRVFLSNEEEKDTTTSSNKATNTIFDVQKNSMTTTKSSSPAASPATSFPLFGKLPREVRYLIWEAAMPGSVVVPRTWDVVLGYRLRRKVPAVLQACTESRRLLVSRSEEIMARRAASSSPKYQRVRMSAFQDGFVCLNWRADSIWISRGYDISGAEIAAYANMENLVMNWGLRPCWVESALENGIRFIQNFPRLKVLSLLVEFKEHGWPELSTLKALKRLKRNEVKRIWALVQKALGNAQVQNPGWTPPALHIVHTTPNWSRQQARHSAGRVQR
ncbi:hypothetical protein BD289DRAFT_486561 [Coniella lustricola]|uniref:2EXR domain-containing protein n=1 Tax=Coniella lustricola TaxID=2025994 RepID=A0A2T2ZUQ3_9PEZI|nr:hypothetical protein BD289DRAFT_486561 [Coniella lustricola]